MKESEVHDILSKQETGRSRLEGQDERYSFEAKG